MDFYPIDITAAIICIAAVLATITFLRVLAIHREHEISHHDLARQVRQARAEHDRKIKEANEEIVV
ncbi:MAG: hypothetical protein WD294_11520 [Phycisphaeraceae bacterium]